MMGCVIWVSVLYLLAEIIFILVHEQDG